MQQGKKRYKTTFSEIFEENSKLFDSYTYVYTGSVVLFWTLPRRKKIPEDMDVAIDRNGKWVDELMKFYRRLKKSEKVEELIIKTVFRKKYLRKGQEIEVKKYQQLNLEKIEKGLLEILMEKGNIRISYKIHGITTEIFPEKNGNGLTNLGIMQKDIRIIKIKTAEKQLINIPFLWYQAIAQGYVMNFLKEIIRNNIYRFTDMHSKPKDGMRLFNIISLLERQGEDASPKGVLKFIKETVKAYEEIPEENRSKYIDSAIKEFPRIEKMFKEIIKEYTNLIKDQESRKYRFVSFYKKLGTYKKELNRYVDYLEKDMLNMLKREILEKKYTITDLVKSFQKKPNKEKIYDQAEVKDISKNIKRISKSIEHIWIKNKNESFAYFYEMYMLKNLFIKPITKIL